MSVKGYVKLIDKDGEIFDFEEVRVLGQSIERKISHGTEHQESFEVKIFLVENGDGEKSVINDENLFLPLEDDKDNE